MIQKEQQLIRTAVLSLLVVLALVYLLVYSVYYDPLLAAGSGQSLGSESPEKMEPNSQPSVNISAQKIKIPGVGQKKQNPIVKVVKNTKTDGRTRPSPNKISRGTSGISSAEVLKKSQKTKKETPLTTPEKVLPGTQRVQSGQVADVIGVKYDYALQDTKGIYYLKLGSPRQDLGALLQTKGGNIFSLTTPTKILANQLVGSRVDYLNLPQYKNKKVLMVITTGGERRMVEIPYSIYHLSKVHITQKFK